MESLMGSIARIADVVREAREKAERLRVLLERACDSTECGEYCPFWKGDDEPCELIAEVRDDQR